MQAYQSRYERNHSARALVRRIILVGIAMSVMVFGTIYVTDYIERQYIRITQDSFSNMEIKQMDYFYGFAPKNSLTPVYAFDQGLSDSGPSYTGIVLNVNTDVGDVLTNSFGLNPDGEVYKRIFNDCRDYFEEHDFAGVAEAIQTDDGRKKAIAFSIEGNSYRMFFFENDMGKLQLMARREE